MRSLVGKAYDRARVKVGRIAPKVLADTCRLIVGNTEYKDVPCELSSAGGNIEGAPYQVRFAWGSQAVIGADVVIDEIPGRPQITLNLGMPIDSSKGIWQEFQATSGPGSGRIDVGV